VNLRQLAYWLAVVDEGSFTRAAARMHVAQPSLSQQIRALEEELGGPLIERLPRAIRLTQAGKAFLPEARATVLSAERAARAARSAMKLEGGELEIATVRSIAVGILPRTIQLWHERHPSVSIRLREYIHRDALAAAVRSGVGDIAIGPRPPDWSGPIAPLGYEEFVVVLPPRDPLASGRGGLPLERLADREWVLFPPHHGLSELVATACGRAGFQPRESVRTEQVEAAARLAAVGLGPTLVPRNMVPAGLDAAALGTEPPVVRELVAFVRADWSAAARGYLDLVQELPWARRPARALVVP
jgi:DNA-binding transcriptional LysR family regulator